MSGYYETQVRRALLTVGDSDVLNEMATGWRASIRDLNTVDDRLKAGIDGLRDHDQLGEATRDAAIGAFRDVRAYVAEQRLLLGKTAQALDAAGGALTQVKSLIRAWDRQGVPTPPGPAPVPDPAATDQTAYWQAASAHRTASAGYAHQLQQREDEARAAWDSLNRVFGIAEDKIRSAHGIPLEEDRVGTEPPTWPPADWPGPPPDDPEPDWPPLPPWPPVSTLPEPGPGLPPGPGPGLPPGPGPGPGVSPGAHPGPEHGTSYPHPGGSGPGGHHPQGPTTTVSGSAQSGVTYAPGGAPGGTVGGSVGAGSAGSAVTAPLGTAGMAGAAGASAGMAMRGGASGGAAVRSGAAGGSGGAGSSSGRSGQKGQGGQAGQAGKSGRFGRGGRAGVGGKGSQQASGQAKSGRGGAAAGGSRGGRRKDRSEPARDDLLATEDQWLDGEGTAPDVLR